MTTIGLEIAHHLEQWLIAEGELDPLTDLSDEAACMLAYFPEMDSIEAEALSLLLFYAPADHRMAPADAVPLVLGDTDFALHFLRCSEDQAYFDKYIESMSAEDEEFVIEMDDVYFDYDDAVVIDFAAA